MSQSQPDRDEDIKDPSFQEPTNKRLTRMLLDVGTSYLVTAGKLPGRLTQAEADAMLAYINAPPTDADFDDMDRVSSSNSCLSKTQVYIILILLFEEYWRPIDIAQAFDVTVKAIYAIKRGLIWPGTYQRYRRDQGLDSI